MPSEKLVNVRDSASKALIHNALIHWCQHTSCRHSHYAVDASVMLLRRVARAAPLRHARTTAAPDPSNWAPLAAAAALLLASQARTEEEELENVVNWSGTHACQVHVKTPETRHEAIQIVAEHASRNERIRPVGGALSPNGLAFVEDGSSLINLALLDKVLNVDVDSRTVTVEAGCRVEQVLEALEPTI